MWGPQQPLGVEQSAVVVNTPNTAHQLLYNHPTYPTYTPMPTFTPLPSPTPEPTAESTVEPEAAPTETPVEPTPSSSQPASGGLSQGSGGRLANLTRIPESGPRPPFTVLTSAIWIESDGKNGTRFCFVLPPHPP